MTIEKIYIDELLKIIFGCDNKELVKFVNKNLGTQHDPENSKVLRLASEFNFKNTQDTQNEKAEKTKYSKRFADTIFSINGCLYNIEFQTTHDGIMLIRVMEYQFHAMLDKIKGISLDDKYRANITLPHSIIIQLEKSKNVADYYQLTYVDSSTGQSLRQKFPVVKMWEHSITDLGKNGQHLILPFKLLEHKKNSIDVDKFLKDIFDIKEQIHNLYNTGVLSEKLYKEMYEAHYNIATTIADRYINKKHPKRKEVEEMFTVIEERPSLVERYVEKRVAKAKAIAIAQKAIKAFELGWSDKEIIDFFEMSVEQARQILLDNDTVSS